jgi:hypothetical protein
MISSVFSQRRLKSSTCLPFAFIWMCTDVDKVEEGLPENGDSRMFSRLAAQDFELTRDVSSR